MEKEKIKVFTVGFWLNGQKFFGISTESNFAEKLISARAETLFPIIRLADDLPILVPRQNLIFAARSCLSSFNEIVTHSLKVFLPAFNGCLVENILKQFSFFTNSLFFNENDDAINKPTAEARLIKLDDKSIIH